MKNRDVERLGRAWRAQLVPGTRVLTVSAVKCSRNFLGKCTNSLCKFRMKRRMCCRETRSLNIFPNNSPVRRNTAWSKTRALKGLGGCGSSGEMGSSPVLQLSNADAHGSKGVVKE